MGFQRIHVPGHVIGDYQMVIGQRGRDRALRRREAPRVFGKTMRERRERMRACVRRKHGGVTVYDGTRELYGFHEFRETSWYAGWRIGLIVGLLHAPLPRCLGARSRLLRQANLKHSLKQRLGPLNGNMRRSHEIDFESQACHLLAGLSECGFGGEIRFDVAGSYLWTTFKNRFARR
jgi:hypothetical protein